MRIGLFGGTFNPIHFGHLRVAVEVKEDFELNELFLIPAALPPHKMPGEVVDAADRLRMLKRAIENTPGLKLSDVELKRAGPSYTIDTVNFFKDGLSEDSQIFLIMGMDAFLEIDTWKSYDELLTQISFIVINRPNVTSDQSVHGWEIMEDYLKSKISSEYIFSSSQSCYMRPEKQPIYVCEVTILDISSTKIRELIKRGRSIEYLVPQKVADFINSKGLYL